MKKVKTAIKELLKVFIRGELRAKLRRRYDNFTDKGCRFHVSTFYLFNVIPVFCSKVSTDGTIRKCYFGSLLVYKSKKYLV